MRRRYLENAQSAQTAIAPSRGNTASPMLAPAATLRSAQTKPSDATASSTNQMGLGRPFILLWEGSLCIGPSLWFATFKDSLNVTMYAPLATCRDVRLLPDNHPKLIVGVETHFERFVVI